MSPVTMRPNPTSPGGASANKISSASSTLCSACAQRVEHRSNYAIATVRTESPAGIRTKLVANGTLVIHACLTESDTSDA